MLNYPDLWPYINNESDIYEELTYNDIDYPYDE